MKSQSSITETHIKIALIVVLLVTLLGIHIGIPNFYQTVWHLSTSGNMEGTIDYLRSFGVWAMVISIIIDIVINIVGFCRQFLFRQLMASSLASFREPSYRGWVRPLASLSVFSLCGLSSEIRRKNLSKRVRC